MLAIDFGYQDDFVGAMKGIILAINPTATIVDLSHAIQPATSKPERTPYGTLLANFRMVAVTSQVGGPEVGSSQRLELAINNSHAAEQLGLHVGEPVTLHYPN